MLTSAYYMLTTGVPYEDLGEMHFDHRDRTKLARRLINRLASLGLDVQVTPLAA